MGAALKLELLPVATHERSFTVLAYGQPFTPEIPETSDVTPAIIEFPQREADLFHYNSMKWESPIRLTDPDGKATLELAAVGSLVGPEGTAAGAVIGLIIDGVVLAAAAYAAWQLGNAIQANHSESNEAVPIPGPTPIPGTEPKATPHPAGTTAPTATTPPVAQPQPGPVPAPTTGPVPVNVVPGTEVIHEDHSHGGWQPHMHWEERHQNPNDPSKGSQPRRTGPYPNPFFPDI